MTDLLEGRVMFVAGVGPSMGSATARIAAREGAKVAVVGDTPSVLEETADSIRAAGGTATAIQCNLANDDDLRAAVETTVAQLGPIDAAFYNAAVYDHAHTSLEIDEGAVAADNGRQPAGPDDAGAPHDPVDARARRRSICVQLLDGVLPRPSVSPRLQRVEGRCECADVLYRRALRAQGYS